MMAVSVGTIVLLTIAICAMALAFGALYPQFETENAAQIPTSFGGLVFMMTTIALLALVIVIEAIPVSRYLRAAFFEQAVEVNATMIGAFALVAAICLGVTAISLKVGLKRMEGFEF
jgi:ABC-2 type transport system permease protein